MPAPCYNHFMMRPWMFSAFILTTAIFFAAGGLAFATDQAAYDKNQEGVAYMKAGKYPEAIAAFKAAHDLAPNNDAATRNLSIAYNNYGFSLMRSGDMDGAIEELQSALYYEPASPYTEYGLGQAFYQIQDMENAKKHLERAYAMKPDIKGLKELLAKTDDEHTAEKGFSTIETSHFIIAFPESAPDPKVSYIKTNLEEAYGKVGGFLDYYPSKRVVVMLYPEASYYGLVKGQPRWSFGVFDGKIRLPLGVGKYSDEDVLRILYHEYMHTVIIDLARGKCPEWLAEGLAGRAEDLGVAKDRELIRKYLEKYGLSRVSSLGGMQKERDREKATWMYIQAYLFADFLEKRIGPSGVREMLEIIGGGGSAKEAVERVAQGTFDDIERKWVNYVVDEYRLNIGVNG